MNAMKNVMLLVAAGLVSAAVFAADKPVNFSDVDTNQDGRISQPEASSFAAVELMFDKADADKNGSLDWKEFAQGIASEKSKK